LFIGAFRVEQPLSLYLHIPFCDTKCAYCDFNSYAGMKSLIPAYTRTLCQELRLWAPQFMEDSVETVFFGGGTPSLTPLQEMETILTAIRASYHLDDGVEMSLEANPGTVDVAHLSGLRRLGFNRLSLGVQSFDDAELQALDRIHTGAEAAGAFEAARLAGFDNVNLDLIYGLAGQSLAGWRQNVERALSLRPEHLSLYALTIEEGTPLAIAISRGKAPSPDPDLQADMYELAQELLESAGYEQYEISNWALPGRACRHNLAYWKNARWLGVGAGAHSSLPGSRFSTALSPRGYIRRVEEAASLDPHPASSAILPQEENGNEGRRKKGNSLSLAGEGEGEGDTQAATGFRVALAASQAPTLTGMKQVVWSEPVDAAMAMSDTLILGLRLLAGVSLNAFRLRHGEDAFNLYGDELRDCIELGLLELDGDRLRLSKAALLLANEVFSRLLPKSAAAS
jgi:oxygen-independent coproporphyrinogen-3 oxidase